MACGIRTEEEVRFFYRTPDHSPQVIAMRKACIDKIRATTNEDILKNFGHCKNAEWGTGLCGRWILEHFDKSDERRSYIGRGTTYREAIIEMEVVRRTHVSEYGEPVKEWGTDNRYPHVEIDKIFPINKDV